MDGFVSILKGLIQTSKISVMNEVLLLLCMYKLVIIFVYTAEKLNGISLNIAPSTIQSLTLGLRTVYVFTIFKE